jgi:hypothetical protein
MIWVAFGVWLVTLIAMLAHLFDRLVRGGEG